MAACPLHPGQPLMACRECELDVAVSEKQPPDLVKPVDPETGRRLKHVPLRELFNREKAELEPTEEGS